MYMRGTAHQKQHTTGCRRCIACLIILVHFLQKSPIISGSFAERDLQLEASLLMKAKCWFSDAARVAYAHTHTHAHTCTQTYTLIHMCVSGHRYTCSRAHTHTNMQTHTNKHTSIHTRTRTSTGAQTYTYTCTKTALNTHLHAHTRRLAPSLSSKYRTVRTHTQCEHAYTHLTRT